MNVPWSAHFLSAGNTTSTFISETCLIPPGTAEGAVSSTGGVTQKKAVVSPDFGWSAWSGNPQLDTYAKAAPKFDLAGFLKTPGSGAGEVVTPNLTSFGFKVDTIDIYQLKQHPKVGVVYIEQ